MLEKSKKLRDFRRRNMPASAAVTDSQYETIIAKIDSLKTERALTDPGSAQPGLQNHLRLILKKLAIEKAQNAEKVRIGSVNDGGYVMLSDFGGATRALSLGIDRNDDWDLAIARMGIQVEQYDDSVETAPSQHPNLIFKRKRIGPDASNSCTTLAELLRDGPQTILKMDIEGSEWRCLDTVDSRYLRLCPQIIVEFHDLRWLNAGETRILMERVFEKLLLTHFPVHIHANNCAPLYLVAGIPIPDVVEMSYASRTHFEPGPSDETFPTSLDAPNNPERDDICLGAFRF